jgi:cobalt-zinc-cadmium resistance protein CzcA
MIDRILQLSIRQRFFIVFAILTLGLWGVRAALDLPIDAVPDITNNQVQINTVAPAFAPLEMERYVTFPIEVAMSNLPKKEEIRSISQFGLSQVTITFDDSVDLYLARQQVLERLITAERELPEGVSPELAPISTGLGEVFQFTVESPTHSLMERRTILDWQIKPQLRTVPGVIEVNSFGGLEKQYEVLVDSKRLVGFNLSLHQVIEALRRNNSNAGGAYLEQSGEQQIVRGVGLIQAPADIERIVVSAHGGTPIYIRDIGAVGIGSQVRQGAATRDGAGETVMGVVMLLKGENSQKVVSLVKERLKLVQKALPKGVTIRPFYDRSELVQATVYTATKSLVEGGLLVVGVLFLFLLQLRAGLIVSSAIPLSMLAAIAGMRYFGVSANLMSLGAIDFGLIVDAAVIMIENSVRHLSERRHALGRRLTEEERLETVQTSSLEVRKASQFGELIIIAAYIPILALVGIEGKMFRPMAFTVILALCAALVLSLTFIPALAAIFLKDREERESPVVRWAHKVYEPTLRRAVLRPGLTVSLSLLFVLISFAGFFMLGSEFIPELDEGAIAMNLVRLKSVSLPEAVRQTSLIERAVKKHPEVSAVVSRIGRPEIATDPMGPDMGDTYIFLKPRSEWAQNKNREELVRGLKEDLEKFPGTAASFSQPIKFRMMELIEGVGSRSDVAVKIYGDELDVLLRSATEVAGRISRVKGAADVRVQQLTGLPSLQVRVNRDAIARYGINVSDVNEVVQSAIAGTQATTILEGFTRFALVVRFPPEARRDAQAMGALLVSAPNGEKVPLSQLAELVSEEGPAEISRENGQRRISVEVNVRGRDIGSFVEEAQRSVEDVKIPSGYIVDWGGTYEHLESGRGRLMVAVPVTFALILLLLFTTFNSLSQALLVFTGIPFAVTGGVIALILRGMPFSMSAGVGFIAVSGVAVLNGVVMISFINHLLETGMPIAQAVIDGAMTRLRPVLMTATVASLGFLPMALSHGTGAEVQRPLATVVIGGLLTSTLLTLVVLPSLYRWRGGRNEQHRNSEEGAI